MHILQRHFEILFIFLLIHTLINSHIFSTHSYFSIIKNTFPFFRPQFGNFRRGLIFSPSSERPQWSVRKGRLSERSEFEPLQRNEGREQEKKYSLDPFFWYLFFRIKTKEKGTLKELPPPNAEQTRRGDFAVWGRRCYWACMFFIERSSLNILLQLVQWRL